MIVNTPGNSHLEQADRKAVLPVRVAISIEHRKIEDMRRALVRGKVNVVV
jgi:hypothetical protein